MHKLTMVAVSANFSKDQISLNAFYIIQIIRHIAIKTAETFAATNAQKI